MSDTENLEGPAAGFWSARPVLSHIHQFARARRRNPKAVLGVSIVYANAVIPPNVGIPPHVGGRASFNMALALCGPSGAGKGTSEATARDAIEFRWATGEPAHIPVYPLGSGEGLARVFMTPKPGKGQTDLDVAAEQVTTAIFSASEIDTAAALFARSGSTLESELRKVFSGEQLGFTNAQAHTRTRVDAHTYRCGQIYGVQPGRAGALLDGADGGTPQRILWMPVLDADMPDHAPDEPAPMTVTAPRFTGDLELPQCARDEIDAHQLAMHRGQVDALDGHRQLVQAKVAAALGILDNRDIASITEEDWNLAGIVLRMSSTTREWVQRQRADATRSANRARALATADRDEIVSARKLQRAKQAIIRWLEKSNELPSSDLRRRLKADLRADFGAAIAELTAEGSISEIDVKNGAAYRLSGGGTRVPESTPQNQQLRVGVPESTRVPEPDVETAESPSSDSPSESARQWLTRHVEELRTVGHATVQAFAVYAAGKAEGHSLQDLHEAAIAHPDVAKIVGQRGSTTWSIAGGRSGAAS